MAITLADFNKIWASSSPLTPYSFSESQYKEGWNFIGGTPPSRQMWDFLQKNNDEKMQYLANNYLPLSGGTLTGAISTSAGTVALKQVADDSTVRIYGGKDDSSANLWLFGKNSGGAGRFSLFAYDGTNMKELRGKPNGELTWNGQPLLPVGIVQAYAGTTIPNGWLLCDGSAVSRTTYANLYACIGDIYGAGDGSTTFNLPNLIDKFVQGNATAGTEKSAGLPNITGGLGTIRFMSTTVTDSGALFSATGGATAVSSSGSGSTTHNTINFDASRSSSIYGNSTTVQPPALTMQYIIKY